MFEVYNQAALVLFLKMVPYAIGTKYISRADEGFLYKTRKGETNTNNNFKVLYRIQGATEGVQSLFDHYVTMEEPKRYRNILV